MEKKFVHTSISGNRTLRRSTIYSKKKKKGGENPKQSLKTINIDSIYIAIENDIFEIIVNQRSEKTN